MDIKDIVNRDIVNLTNCEHEPIHIPGSIQPHGFLLAVHSEKQTIDYSSGNVHHYLSVGHAALLGMSFASVFGKEQWDNITDYYEHHKHAPALPIRINLLAVDFLCNIHHNGSHYVIEAEPLHDNKPTAAELYNQTALFVSYMNNTDTLRQLCKLVAEGTRESTGYDRVMIYRFDKEFNGEVFAESCRDDLEPFLGLHYPHTDIPPQARALYMKNLLRLIVDINYSPVPIFTIDDAPDKNLDLSLSTLRSTSPIHVEYLRNMGVGATLTISLIHHDRLWGLIACHHYSPMNLTPEKRLAAQLQGQFITSQIDVRQSKAEFEIAKKTNIALEKMNAYNLPPIYESFKIVSVSPDLLKLCNASGVSILVGGQIYKSGFSPSDADIIALSDWLYHYSNDSNFSTDRLINFVPQLKQLCDDIAGIIYHSLGNGNCIIWYRPETITEVNWAGDPNKAIIKDSKGLHPRNSFRLWKQIVKCRSNEWRQSELNAAANYAHALQKQISLLLLTQEEEKYRRLSEVLRETNAELENINWISTHDLQEPLRKIQLLSSRLLYKEEEVLSGLTLDSLQRMNDSANRMQRLLVDILKYTRIKHTTDAFERADLNLVLKDVLEELKELIAEKNAVITTEKLPVVSGIPFLLQQLFSNLILNTLKYASEERQPFISIDYLQEEASIGNHRKLFHVIKIADNGIGFSDEYAESIFKIFTRLHKNGEYKGSGVGLALCRKIMQTHDGSISATGRAGEGAIFTLYFPEQG